MALRNLFLLLLLLLFLFNSISMARVSNLVGYGFALFFINNFDHFNSWDVGYDMYAMFVCCQEMGHSYPVVVSTWPFVEAVRAAWRSVNDRGLLAVEAVVDGCSACEEMRCDGTGQVANTIGFAAWFVDISKPLVCFAFCCVLIFFL